MAAHARTDDETSTAPFVACAWIAWALGPVATFVWHLDPIAHGPGAPLPWEPFPIQPNAAALVLLLFAAARWQGWRRREFWILLTYFCALSILLIDVHLCQSLQAMGTLDLFGDVPLYAYVGAWFALLLMMLWMPARVLFRIVLLLMEENPNKLGPPWDVARPSRGAGS